MKLFITFLFLFFYCLITKAQCNKDLNMYKHSQIFTESDTINYHIYSKKQLSKISNVLVFIQGSGAFPMFTIDRNNKSLVIESTMPFDLKTIPDDFALILVSKKGIPFCINKNEKFETPKSYYNHETLENRVNRIDLVINDFSKKAINKLDKIVVIGHSEGSDVVAKLGAINKKLTHIGYWSGGANTQFYDFTLFIRKEVLSGKISEKEGVIKTDSLLNKIKEITNKPNSISDFWKDNTYFRWNNFSEPPINNLLQIDIPIFVAIGAKDQAVPIESANLIPIEFLRNHKNNLTYKVYPDLDHGFEKKLQNETYEDHWNIVFSDFLDWLNISK